MADGHEQARNEAVTRLRRIEGQIRGLQRMVEEAHDCEAILTQLMAARAALDSVGLFLVERHLDECLRGAADPRLRERLQRIVELFLRFGSSGVSGERSAGDGCRTS
ncbi:MAG: metal-sensitive transcriptional regulator [Anaerolineae bacterium]|nr:metal-sensitive transcriptional regulator [Anaerolineae bacterium]